MTPTWVSVTALVISILALVMTGCGPIRRGFWGARAWIAWRRRARLKRLRRADFRTLELMELRARELARRAAGGPLVKPER